MTIIGTVGGFNYGNATAVSMGVCLVGPVCRKRTHFGRPTFIYVSLSLGPTFTRTLGSCEPGAGRITDMEIKFFCRTTPRRSEGLIKLVRKALIAGNQKMGIALQASAANSALDYLYHSANLCQNEAILITKHQKTGKDP
ncbi:hypothetical protein CRG98_044466 [Punica granatum]|uniref:Uncharacterized protein n=1 Tax=Punica granatum TaxID=22663 RepID=A0A2I0HU03_PUNGR|nr:hypothetical protein CRG98_044466 [Punica granatum]